MGNNKNKGQKTDDKTKKTTAAPAAAPAAQTKKEQPKTGLKEDKTPKPAAPTTPKKEEKETKKPTTDATGTVENVAAEEVKKPVTSPLESPKVDSLISLMGPNDLMDANHAAEFLSALERRTARMDRSKPITIQMESMLDYNMMWYAVRLSVQSFAQKRECNMLTPNDELIVQQAIDTAASMGVALEAHPTDDPNQMRLEFKDISPETKAAADAENAASGLASTVKPPKHVKLTEEQMNPLNWKNDDEAKAAITQDLQESGETPSNKFLRILGKIKTYRENITEDPVQKGIWSSANLGTLAKEYFNIIGKKGIVVLSGLMSSTTTSLKLGQTMIFAHSLLRKNMKGLNDQDVVDLIKAFIEVMHADPAQPIEQDPCVVKGILAPTRDTFVRIALQKPAEDELIDWFKKIMGPFYDIYKDEVGSKSDEDFALKAANKMIEIRNMYVDKEAAFPLFTKEDFKAVMGK